MRIKIVHKRMWLRKGKTVEWKGKAETKGEINTDRLEKNGFHKMMSYHTKVCLRKGWI